MTKRKRIVLIFSFFGLTILLFAIYIISGQHRINRYFAFAGYANAIRHFCETSRPIPSSLEEIERTYTAYDGHYVELPTGPPYLRPTYRPAGTKPPGKYLVLIENKPPGFSDFTHWIIFSSPEGGELEVRNVWDWELDDLVRNDDDLRSASPSSSHAKDGR